MIAKLRGRGLTLAVYPNGRGMAWIAFEGASSPYDWGFCIPKRDKSQRCLVKLERLFSRLQPDVLVLEHEKGGRTHRVEKLQRAMVDLASAQGVEVALYSRGDVQTCFAPLGALTRQQIAEAVGRHIDMLGHLVPPPRKPWETEHRRLALFNAAALVLTYESSSAFK